MFWVSSKLCSVDVIWLVIDADTSFLVLVVGVCTVESVLALLTVVTTKPDDRTMMVVYAGTVSVVDFCLVSSVAVILFETVACA